MTTTDNRVNLPIELTDEEWYTLMRMAHDRDITLNQLVNQLLTEELERIEKERENDPA